MVPAAGAGLLPQHLPDVKCWVAGGGRARVVLELHGFQDSKVGDRMHIEIRRPDSVHWFESWAGRLEAIWDAAREPGPDGRVTLSRVPADRTDDPEATPE